MPLNQMVRYGVFGIYMLEGATIIIIIIFAVTAITRISGLACKYAVILNQVCFLKLAIVQNNLENHRFVNL